MREKMNRTALAVILESMARARDERPGHHLPQVVSQAKRRRIARRIGKVSR